MNRFQRGDLVVISKSLSGLAAQSPVILPETVGIVVEVWGETGLVAIRFDGDDGVRLLSRVNLELWDEFASWVEQVRTGAGL